MNPAFEKTTMKLKIIKSLWNLGLGDTNYYRMVKNKVPSYSSGNYIQYPVINHNGKKYKKLSLFADNMILYRKS